MFGIFLGQITHMNLNSDPKTLSIDPEKSVIHTSKNVLAHIKRSRAISVIYASQPIIKFNNYLLRPFIEKTSYLIDYVLT